MIFVILGSQKFQFNRLLQKLDDLIVQRIIEEVIFAQTGYSDYIPVNYSYQPFLDRNIFTETLKKSSLIITHGGTGAIINSVKAGKKVIAVPRLVKCEEHVDNHQLQLLKQFDDMGIIKVCYELEQLGKLYESIHSEKFATYKSSTQKILKSIEEFLDTLI